MMRIAGFVWLLIFVLAGAYLSVRVSHGLHFQTDLMALLPQEEQNQDLKRSNDLVNKALSQHVVFLIGHQDKAKARAAAKDMAQSLTETNLIDGLTDTFDKDQIRQIGTLYFPYRSELLSHGDRELLKADQGGAIADRALAQVFGIVGMANAKLLQNDPFLLLPDFLTNLPIPLSRLSLDDGLLSMQENGMTWILIAGQLQGSPFDLDVQKKVTEVYDAAVKNEAVAHPGLEVLHLGAVFFAKDGAEEAMRETSSIGLFSTLGIIALMLIVFCAVRPLLLSLLVIGVGIMMALSICLLFFGELHVGALLFGISLIGVTVDYSLQYCSEIFATPPGTSKQRLKRVFAGITLGAATTIIGYLTLYLAPFPGLHQIAAFSALGILASWITVVLWLPYLDKKSFDQPTRHPRGERLVVVAKALLVFWENPHYQRARQRLAVGLALLACVGFWHFHVDDNVRHMQSLSGGLVAEQEKIQRLIGATTGNQFFIVQARNDEEALQKEEQLADRLWPLVASGELAGFQSPAQYIPSEARQTESRSLQLKHLYVPFLAQQSAQLNMIKAPQGPDSKTPFLTMSDIRKLEKPPFFLKNLLLDPEKGEVTHTVLLDAVLHPEAVAKAAEGIEGVRLVDPAHDFSHLLGKYRSRSLILLVLSALLMMPLLIRRYGFQKGLRVLTPPFAALLLTPALRSLTGASFTFFDAMALILVLSIGVDYAVFCTETSEERKPVTMIAVTMAACTALLSFGLLALSHVAAVHHFGATMTLGILLSFLFAPLARCSQKPKDLLNPFSKHLIVIASLFLLSACSGSLFSSASPSSPAANEALLSKPVSIAPNVGLVLPMPSDLGQSVNVVQLVTATYGDQSFAFEAHIRATPEHFLMVGLDLMGRKLMTIDWTQESISYEAAPWVPSELRPENILADIVLLYWPEAVVRTSLRTSEAPSAAKLVVGAHSRTIMLGDQTLWQANYEPAKTKNIWDGALHYQNIAFGYHFDVQSIEAMQ